jgi:hypothetical protein
MDITIESGPNGLTLSTLEHGIYYHRLYQGYPRSTARQLFRAYVRKLERETV